MRVGLRAAKIIGGIGAVSFYLIFLWVLGLTLERAVDFLPLPVWLLSAIIIAVNLGFFVWLKAPTAAGRRILDQIEGFKLYLSVAEKERLEILHPPEKTPALFERLLPYAMALDVEHQWGEQFTGVLTAAGSVPGEQGWYSGTGESDPGNLGSTLGDSLASAVAASSSPPGSSSGSSGGGSSGGGGGGGGGGGW